jgi:hypothetical protein
MHRYRVFILAASVFAMGAAEAQAGSLLRAFAGRAAVRAGAGAVGSAAGAASGAVSKTYGPDVLTVDQLTACVRSAADLDKNSDDIAARSADLDAKIGEIKARKAKLEERSGKVDGGNKKAVALYNAEVETTNKLIKTVKADQPRFNEDVRTHNGRIEEYNGRCAKRYYADDMELAKQQANVVF